MTDTSKGLTLKIDSALVRFPPKEATLVNELLTVKEASPRKQVFLSARTLEEKIWGDISGAASRLVVLVNAVRRRVPGLILSGPAGEGYELSRKISVERTRKVIKRGPGGFPAAPPTLVLQVDGSGQVKLAGREAALVRFMLKDKRAWRTTQEIQRLFGLNPSERRAADKVIVSVRGKAADIFQTGERGKGWRLNPRRRIYVVADHEPQTS